MTLVLFPCHTLPTHCLYHVAPPRSRKNAGIAEINRLVHSYAESQQIYDFDRSSQHEMENELTMAPASLLDMVFNNVIKNVS